MTYRERIVEVLAKYNVKLEDAPLDALTMAMERMGSSLLRPASKATPPASTQEAAENARWYRETLKPFA